MSHKTDLSKWMFALAESGHPRWIELRELATKFDKATSEFYADPQLIDAKTFLGHWARASRCYRECKK